jgi:hypothetical protein
MISKRECYCSVLEESVEAIVEESSAGRGKGAAVRRAFLRCSRSGVCSKSAFCRFVNPLTTRNPLSLERPGVERENVA